jgi:hypothetical protein
LVLMHASVTKIDMARQNNVKLNELVKNHIPKSFSRIRS